MASHAGHSASNGLKEQGDDVAGDEDAGVGEGLDVGIFRTECDDDAGEGEIDACSEKGGGDCQADNLHKESVL